MEIGNSSKKLSTPVNIDLLGHENASGNSANSPQSMKAKAWERFRRHPAAIISMAVLFIILLGVILVSLSPYDPNQS